MKVVVLGLRGLTDVQGGVETHARHLYPRLADLGCDVEIVVRSPFVPRGRNMFGSIRLRRLWSPRMPGVEAFLHSILGVIYAGIVRPDLLHIHAVGPAIVTPLARAFGLRVVVTNHGPDYDRDKWGALARWFLRTGERLGMTYATSRIVISRVIRDLVQSKYQRDSFLIPNGVAATQPSTKMDVLSKYGLQPGRYFLEVGRLVPEKRQLDLLRAYRSVASSGWKLAIVGGLAGDSYSKRVEREALSTGATLTGFLSGESLHQMYSHAGAFILPSSHEGLPIALLEAMSYGLPVLASDIPANLELGLDSRCYFPLGDVDALAERLRQVTTKDLDDESRQENVRWVAARYDWDTIAIQTLNVYRATLGQNGNRS